MKLLDKEHVNLDKSILSCQGAPRLNIPNAGTMLFNGRNLRNGESEMVSKRSHDQVFGS